jgi:hypothetical protein
MKVLGDLANHVINLQIFLIFRSRSEDLFSCKFANSWKPKNGLILTEIEDARNTLQVTLQQSYSNYFLPN